MAPECLLPQYLGINQQILCLAGLPNLQWKLFAFKGIHGVLWWKLTAHLDPVWN